MNKKIDSIIIGMGNIGYFYDQNLNQNFILSHNRAININKNFNLIAVVDNDNSKIKKIKKNFKNKLYLSVDSCLKIHNPELVVVATPKNTHYKILKKLLIKKSVKFIVCEKPVCSTLEQFQKILNLQKKYKKKIFVNYTRNYNPALNTIKKNIDKKVYGSFNKGIVWYTKDLIENGSHFVSLMIYFFGIPKNYRLIDKNNNSEIDFLLIFKDISIFFINRDYKSFSMGTFELYSKNYKISFEDDKSIEIYKFFNDTFQRKEKKMKLFKTINYPKNQNISYLYQNIFNNLNKSEKIMSDVKNALLTKNIIHKIINDEK